VVGSVAAPRVVVPGWTAVQKQRHEGERQGDPKEPSPRCPASVSRPPVACPLHFSEISHREGERHISTAPVPRRCREDQRVNSREARRPSSGSPTSAS
jgi:hypothetical protein